MATLDAYTLGSATKLATLAVSSADWLHRANEHGAGRAVVNGTVAATLLAEDVYVRVNDGTRDVFAFFPTGKPRRQQGAGSLVELSGPGMRWLWSRALIYPESSCRPVDVRWFGPMSKVYVPDADWTNPVSLGRHDAFPVGNHRGVGMADRTAHLVSYTDSQDLTDEKCRHRVEFTLDEDTDVVIHVYADDFYSTMLDAAPVTELSTSERPYNWREVQEFRGTLCEGVHVLYFEFGNLDLPSNQGANPLYICWSVMRAAGAGIAGAANHAVSITHNATSGTWFATINGYPTADIAWDASIGTVESAFNDVAGDDEVEVTGSPGAYTVTFNGSATGYTAQTVGVNGDLLGGGTIAVQTSAYGGSADYIAHSDATTGKVLDPVHGRKGLTAHQILSTVKSDEQAKGNTVLDHVALTSSTATTDTAGNALPELVIEVPLDNATGDRVIEIMIEAGMKFDTTPSLVQQMWGATRGTDLSASVAYTIGDGSNVPLAAHDASSVVNVLRWLSKNGWTEEPDAPSIAIHGRAGDIIRLEAYDDDGVGQFTPQLLEDLKNPQEPLTLEVPSGHAVLPYDQFVMADIISVPAWSASGYAASPVRVLEIGGRIVGAGHVWTLRGTT